MTKTTLLCDELEAVLLEAVLQNPLTADISEIEIAIEGPDVDRAARAKGRLACDWRVARFRRGGRPFFDGAFDHPLETDDHHVAASDVDVRRAFDATVATLRERYAVTP